MDSNDKKKFFEIMTGLAENFSAQVSGPGLKLRFEVLSRYSIESFEAAAVHLLNTRDRMGMPTVAEFVKVIDGEPETMENKAVMQVNTVMRQIRELGSWGQPIFEDPATKALMSSRWSWRSVCAMTETELKWWAKEFVDAYQSAVRCGGHEGGQIEHASSRLRLLAGGIGK